MEVPQETRGRSPSIGNKNRSPNPSTSPHPQFPDHISPLELENTTSTSTTANPYSAPLFTGSHNPSTSNANDQLSFATSQYLTPSVQENQNNLLGPSSSSVDPSFNSQPQQFSQSFEASFLNQLGHSSQIKSQSGDQYPDLLNSTQPNFDDFTIFSNPDPTTALDTSSLVLDPQLDQPPHNTVNQSINPADLSRMSSPHNPTSPHLIPPDAHSSPGPSSPSSTHAYYTPQHSRHTSLDPASAAFLTNQHSDWQGMLGNPAFQGHRRAPSEHSDVSSVNHSPYLTHQDAFDDSNHSPLLGAQTDPSLYDNAFGIEAFSLSDHGQHQHQQQQQQGFSPAHSPYISPRLVPQQPQSNTDLGPDNSFILTQHVNNQLAPPPDIYTTKTEQSPFPSFQPQISGDMGQAAQMTPPSINVELAPPSKNTTYAPKLEADADALSPPMNSKSLSEKIFAAFLSIQVVCIFANRIIRISWKK